MDAAGWYRAFGSIEAAASSPTYERLSHAVADDVQILERLALLPHQKQQPNLLFAACQYLAAPLEDVDAFRAFVLEQWSGVADLMLERSTQTNEPARTGTLLPLLARVEGPLALIEVGASAGLCLYPDRYRIGYDGGPPVGPDGAPVHVEVRTYGAVPLPSRPLEVAWRAGIDLNPLDVTDADDVRWLTACIWPEHEQRRQRLQAAIDVVRGEPPLLVRGDLVEAIGDLLADVPPGATPVVFHSAVLSYVSDERRRELIGKLRRAGVRWISNEGPGVVSGVTTDAGAPPVEPTKAYFVVALDGEAVATADPHGGWLRWLR